PHQGWEYAEVRVADSYGVDLGPSPADGEYRVTGWTHDRGPLRVALSVVHQGMGSTWIFDVEPDPVPVQPPLVWLGETSSRRPWRRR
ncbi:MAG: hypothetical protein QGG40_14130, partial [Myxococcota bacterium]|nr:hypothetical protein [Myxococcota bacterium]